MTIGQPHAGPDPLVILVVEDEFLVRMLIAEYLRGWPSRTPAFAGAGFG